MNGTNGGRLQKSLIGDALSFAFNGIFANITSWARMWFSMIGIWLAVIMGTALIGGITTFFLRQIYEPFGIIGGVFLAFALFMISPGFMLGYFRILLHFYGTNTVSYYAFASFKQIVLSIISFFLVLLLMFSGLILFIIPGLIVIIRSWFTMYLIVDKNLGPIAAIRASWDMTRSQWGPMLGLVVIGIIMNMVPIIGWLMTGLMTVYVYKELNKQPVV